MALENDRVPSSAQRLSTLEESDLRSGEHLSQRDADWETDLRSLLVGVEEGEATGGSSQRRHFLAWPLRTAVINIKPAEWLTTAILPVFLLD